MSQDVSNIALQDTQTLNMDMTTTVPSSSTTLKRRASSSFEGADDNSRKRLKEDDECIQVKSIVDDPICSLGYLDGHKLADEMAEELQCGCCSELLYKPVLVIPCQHFFCGR